MRCLKCLAEINEDYITTRVDSKDEIEISVTCTECDEEYLKYLKLKDLIIE